MLLKDQQYLPVSTAPPDDSIWQGINQATFRQNIASLEKSFKTRPGPKEAVPRDGWEKRRAELSSQDYIIPFNTEQQLAEDFVFLVAAEPESKATSAVCIEEQSEPEGLVVRLAADEPVTTRVRKALKDILGLLVDRAKKRISRNECTERVFDIVIRINRDRIHARLHSSRWERSASYASKVGNGHPTPLYKALNQIVVRLRSSHCCCSNSTGPVCDILNTLSDTYRSVEDIPERGREIQALKAVCRESNEAFQWWARSISASQYPDRDKRCCFSKAAIQQIGKIGRYWSLSANLTSAARKYADLFSNLRYDILTPYQSTMFQSHSGQLTHFCHVHAEVQMVAFYESEENGVRIRPRVIGASKAACYLCNLFIYSHGSFFLSQTQGQQLHGQWTVPDLAQYPPTGRMRLRAALSEVNDRIGREAMAQSADHLPSLDLLDLRERILSGITPSDTNTNTNTSTRSVSSNRLTSTGHTSAATRARTPSTLPSSISSLSLPPPAHPVSAESVSDGSTSTQFLNSKHISDGHDLDEDTILHVMANHIWMNFEMEGPKRGRIAVRPTPPPDGAPIDFTARVEDIADGSQIHIAKRSGSKVVNLELVYGQGRPVFVSLRWY
ncbi:hypothetical protein DTO164E3_8156 [Paecilomyces variotii]|nr:hypothetical protein DTO032I3_8556 [Paecilomyces variotii]KAJ9192923.1 hypothetical protein DTO164E3_8156 [Paecilomyces variotii]KAJ9281947.1 hypothetical protein DTO021D3_1243 [Paecilomyces variotii]KAJ9341950.1 hypothetical protein DTO027B6_5397 [Paecilomyces variotii]KAJ9388578.1 hypothetical protein DTO032I4_2548 [Paecilomyces variotii]